jgi:GDPmannose 4,6-dehydratase
MLQQPAGGDFVVATGKTHSIRDLLDAAFAAVGIDDWNRYVEQDAQFFRPAEIDLLIGDATQARTVLGWQPTVEFAGLVEMMVEADLRRLADSAG